LGRSENKYADADYLIREHLPTARKIANALRNQGYWRHDNTDEHLSVAYETLIRAATDFNPFKGTKFTSYLYMRIKSALIDEGRKWNRDYRFLGAQQSGPELFDRVSEEIPSDAYALDLDPEYLANLLGGVPHVQLAIEHWKHKVPVKELARRLGVKRYTVERWIKEAYAEVKRRVYEDFASYRLHHSKGQLLSTAFLRRLADQERREKREEQGYDLHHTLVNPDVPEAEKAARFEEYNRTAG
jgi:RNA polymerase sigma factor (sigma-70 family)